MATEDRWHDFAKEKPSEDMEGRNFIVSNGYSDTLSMWCGGYWENEPFMGSKLCDEVVRWKGYLTHEEEKANEATRTELKADKTFVFGEECEAYKKSVVDELLAEKDEEIYNIKYSRDEWAKACNQKDKEIARQNTEIKEAVKTMKSKEEEIVQLKQKLEDVKATHYAESVDAGMRERRLRRLLWHAIALFCARSCEYFNGIMSHCLMGQEDLYKRCEEKKNKYLNATNKCRAKEKEYTSTSSKTATRPS